VINDKLGQKDGAKEVREKIAKIMEFNHIEPLPAAKQPQL
jgi:hypothetical protein